MKRLEHATRGDLVRIPQQDGTVQSFHPDELPKAYLSALDLARGRDVEAHPMLEAIRNSSDPTWRNTWSDLLEDVSDEPAEDLSE